MIRLSVDLEPLYRLYDSYGNDPVRPILKHALALESAGADGIVIGNWDAYSAPRRKLLVALAESLNISLLVRVSNEKLWIETLSEIRPTMAIFKLEEQGGISLQDSITGLQVANILVAFEFQPQLELVKLAAKLKGDFVAFDVSNYLNSGNINDQIDQLNNISKSAALASRLSLGCIASGDFTLQKLNRLIETKSIEEIFTGISTISESLLYGYEKSISRFKI